MDWNGDRRSGSDPLYLTAQIHLGVTQEGPFILDVLRDKYTGFKSSESGVLAKYVVGWPIIATAAETRSVGFEAEQKFLNILISQAVLTRDARMGKSAAPTLLERPTRSLIEEDLDNRARFRVFHLMTFSLAMLTARWLLRSQPFHKIVHRVRERRARSCQAGAPADEGRARELVAAFKYMRPLLFSGPDRCLLDALGLIEFLRRYRLFPYWVFGIQSRPFVAHCWVQHGLASWDDCVERSGEFEPIAAF